MPPGAAWPDDFGAPLQIPQETLLNLFVTPYVDDERVDSKVVLGCWKYTLHGILLFSRQDRIFPMHAEWLGCPRFLPTMPTRTSCGCDVGVVSNFDSLKAIYNSAQNANHKCTFLCHTKKNGGNLVDQQTQKLLKLSKWQVVGLVIFNLKIIEVEWYSQFST